MVFTRFSVTAILLYMVFGLSACTSEQVYNAMASHQCQRDAQQEQNGNIAECTTEDKVDGKTYREYERERKE